MIVVRGYSLDRSHELRILDISSAYTLALRSPAQT